MSRVSIPPIMAATQSGVEGKGRGNEMALRASLVVYHWQCRCLFHTLAFDPINPTFGGRRGGTIFLDIRKICALVAGIR